MSLTLATGGNIELPKAAPELAQGGNVQYSFTNMSLKRKMLFIALGFITSAAALIGGYLLTQPYTQATAKIANATNHTATTFTTYVPDQVLTYNTGLILGSLVGVLLIMVGIFLALVLITALLPLPAKIKANTIPVWKGVEVSLVTILAPTIITFLAVMIYIGSGGEQTKSTYNSNKLGSWSEKYIGRNLENDILANKIGSTPDKTYVAFSDNGIKTTYTVQQERKDAGGKTITYKIINRELLK